MLNFIWTYFHHNFITKLSNAKRLYIAIYKLFNVVERQHACRASTHLG